MNREDEAAVLENEISEQCGILNVATGRRVSLIGRVLTTESYAGAGIRHPSGERMDDECVVFREPPLTNGEVAAATLAAPTRDYPEFVDLDDPVFGVADDDDDVVGIG